MAINDSYPNRAINHLHACALEYVASGHAIIADGTRRDDRVPMLKLPDVQRLEDTRKCTYIRPLLGYGRRAVDALVDIHLEIEENESEKIEKSDYEVELRAIIEKRHGPEMVRTIFPERHIQSRVIGRKTAPGLSSYAMKSRVIGRKTAPGLSSYAMRALDRTASASPESPRARARV
jgi:predicted subunit of tRNA(5-methylaminomethyl-2-thiouridylate) methyltransferase